MEATPEIQDAQGSSSRQPPQDFALHQTRAQPVDEGTSVLEVSFFARKPG
jgi:hypothetical protein